MRSATPASGRRAGPSRRTVNASRSARHATLLFVGEPGANLVRREILTSTNGAIRGHNAYADEQKEFILHQGYRMDYVLTEADCRHQRQPDDPVGMGSYNMDSHNCARYVTPAGFVQNEGDVQVRVRPYPVSYRSIRPRAAECANLLVPVCLSATHVAYGSIRMEPVFMILGHSAGVAAAQAIAERSDVQGIDRTQLRAQLLRQGQVLERVATAAR